MGLDNLLLCVAEFKGCVDAVLNSGETANVQVDILLDCASDLFVCTGNRSLCIAEFKGCVNTVRNAPFGPGQKLSILLDCASDLFVCTGLIEGDDASTLRSKIQAFKANIK